MTLEISQPQRSALLDGEPLNIGARAFDVLTYLHDNADRVVTKTELLDHVWSGKLVEESNLTVQIATLRKALGAQAIKTVAGVGYRFALPDDGTGTATATARGQGPDLPDVPSLAVLPFTNLTGATDRDYLVDGIVNEIITALSRVKSFFVVSSTSSFTYKGKTIDLTDVGRDLGVRYVLEGSIQQAGDQLRVFTQLVEASSGHMIWQERFDGQASALFDLQDRIAETVAGALEPKLIWAEADHAKAKPTGNLAAYDLCLRASPLVYRQTTLARLEEGLALLQQALALDADYIHAKALTCYAHTGAFAARWWPFDKAQAALGRAREVLESHTDDPLALAYAGHYLAYIGQAHHEGLAALKRAFALNANSATIALLLGWVHIYLDENDAAIDIFERARRISPLHPQTGIVTCGIANACLQKGGTEAAIAHYEQAIAEFPEFASSQIGLMACYWRDGRAGDSARIADWLRAKVPDMTVATFLRTRPQTSALYVEAVAGALRANGFPD